MNPGYPIAFFKKSLAKMKPHKFMHTINNNLVQFSSPQFIPNESYADSLGIISFGFAHKTFS